MKAVFQLVELTSGNVVGDYATKRAALECIHQAVLEHGRRTMADYALFELVDGKDRLVALGYALSLRARTFLSISSMDDE